MAQILAVNKKKTRNKPQWWIQICQSRVSDKMVALCHGGVQALAETDPEAGVQLQAINAQLKAVSQRIHNYDEEKADELEDERAAQSRGRTQLCYFVGLVAVGLVAIAVWALS